MLQWLCLSWLDIERIGERRHGGASSLVCRRWDLPLGLLEARDRRCWSCLRIKAWSTEGYELLSGTKVAGKSEVYCRRSRGLWHLRSFLIFFKQVTL